MSKLSVVEAAEVLGVTKEAVYNRVRRGTLNSITEDGVKYVILDEEQVSKNKTPQSSQKRRKKSIDERYIELLLEQIEELKEANKKLELDKERLIAEKEALLIKSKEDVENIYKDRDKQLKNILTVVTKPLLTQMKKDEPIDAEFEELSPYEQDLVANIEVDVWRDLDEYMKSKNYSNKKKKSITSQVLEQLGQNKYIKEENGTLLIKRGRKLKEILGS